MDFCRSNHELKKKITILNDLECNFMLSTCQRRSQFRGKQKPPCLRLDTLSPALCFFLDCHPHKYVFWLAIVKVPGTCLLNGGASGRVGVPLWVKISVSNMEKWLGIKRSGPVIETETVQTKRRRYDQARYLSRKNSPVLWSPEVSKGRPWLGADHQG